MDQAECKASKNYAGAYIVMPLLLGVILQQEYVISELQEYASELPATEKSVSDQTISTVEYLKACNKIFERGILAKKGFIKDSSSPLIRSMEDGFNFFTNWLDEKLIQG